MQQTSGGPSSGRSIHPRGRPARITNRSGASTSVGLALALDLGADATETTSFDPRDGKVSSWGAGVLPDTGGAGTDTHYGILAVCTEVAADNALVSVATMGLLDCLCVADTYAAGVPLEVNNAGKFTDTTAAGGKYFARYQGTVGAVSEGVQKCVFNGWHGFGFNAGT